MVVAAAVAAAVGTTVVVASVLVASWFVVQRVVSVVGGSTATVVLAAGAAAAVVGGGGGVIVPCTAHCSRQVVPSLQCVANDLSDIVFNGCGARVNARKERGTTVCQMHVLFCSHCFALCNGVAVESEKLR